MRRPTLNVSDACLSRGWQGRLHKEERASWVPERLHPYMLPDSGHNVTSCFMLLLPCLPSTVLTFTLWARTVPSLCYLIRSIHHSSEKSNLRNHDSQRPGNLHRPICNLLFPSASKRFKCSNLPAVQCGCHESPIVRCANGLSLKHSKWSLSNKQIQLNCLTLSLQIITFLQSSSKVSRYKMWFILAYWAF